MGQESISSFVKRKTAAAYGYLWGRAVVDASDKENHYQSVAPLLPAGHLRGRVLDAGCGVGKDSWTMASSNGCRLWSVDLSWQGVQKTAERLRHLCLAAVLQADLERLPFSEGAFDFVYSYGVVHHLPDPFLGFQELVRVLKPQGVLAIYVYEDFKTRTALERLSLGAVKILRRLTTRIPHRLLYGLCWFSSPLFFLSMTLPYRILARWPGTRRCANRIPFRHGRSWFGLTGDLYDRFAAPLERRYGKEELQAWFSQAGFTSIRVEGHRGWVACGVKN